MAIIESKELVFDYITRDEEAKVTDVNRAIDGVSLKIEEGSFVAILGHNGSGKSTFAKTLNGILLPSGGAVFISGMNTADDAKLLDLRLPPEIAESPFGRTEAARRDCRRHGHASQVHRAG